MNTLNILKVLVAVLLCTASICQAGEGSWTRKSDMPTARSGVSSSVVDGKIYVMGGGSSRGIVITTVEQYDPAADTWTSKANMQTPRGFFGASTVNGKVYVIGGYGSGGANLSSAEEYDPVVDTWTRKSDMPTARAMLSACAVNGKIYAIGGLLTNGNPLSAVEEYNPTTDTWMRKADMPTRRLQVSCSTSDGIIYAIGGATAMGGAVISTVEAYDPATDTWTTKAPMPTARIFFSTCVANGKIYAIGGCKDPYNSSELSSVEEYDPATDTWTKMPDMQVRRKALASAAVNGKIYAIGGEPMAGWDASLSTVEEYDTGFTVIPSPDFNGNGIVDGADISIMVDHWHTDNALYDIAPPPFGDGFVDVQDLIVLSEHLFEDYRMVAHWKMDETEGMIAHDDVGGYDGTCYGEPLWQPADGKVTGALEFDGMDDYVDTDFVQKLADGSFSAFAWIKGGSPGQAILSQVDSSVGRTYILGSRWLGTDPSNGRLVTTLMDQPFGLLESQVIITDGQWHHIGLVYALDGRQRRLYVDGVEVAGDTAFVDGILSDGGFHFGAGRYLSATSFWLGLIDDVRIYNKALTAEEIEAISRYGNS